MEAAVLTVAESLLPAQSFDRACALVLRYLRTEIPLETWSVSRISDGFQTHLVVDGGGYLPLGPGVAVPVEDTMCRWMVEGAAPRIAPDVCAVRRYKAAADASPYRVRTYVGTPIVRADGTLFGSLCGFDPEPGPASLQEHAPLLDVLSSLLSAVLDADLRATAAARALETAVRDAETDALTGLLNRRGWDRFVQLEEERFRRFGDAASVIVLDLDNLKTVNDVEGHDAGDRYIRAAARALASTVRSGDVLARLGGDEFGVIVVGVTPEEAAVSVARAEEALAQAGVSGSFGHAPYSIIAGFPGAWKAADEAMYAEKRRRRTGRGDTAQPGRAARG